MPDLHVIHFAQIGPTPWRNGGGTTREIACSPAGATADTFDWRISIAEIDQAGPFSRFAGVDRVLTVLEGTGMTLTVLGTRHHIVALRPFGFDGGLDTTCELADGPVRVLNVMHRPDRCQIRLDPLAVAPATTIRGPERGRCYVIAVGDRLTVLPPGGDPAEVRPLDVIEVRAQEEIHFGTRGQVLRVDITPGPPRNG